MKKKLGLILFATVFVAFTLIISHSNSTFAKPDGSFGTDCSQCHGGPPPPPPPEPPPSPPPPSPPPPSPPPPGPPGPPNIDVTGPLMTSFAFPASSDSLIVPITSLTAVDNTGVTGYKVTESSTAPGAADWGWSTTPPTSYTFSSPGNKSLYAWAKDAAGNVSQSLSASVTISLPSSQDTSPPTITGFTIPGTSNSLTIPINAFTASDNVGVNGYKITESANSPPASDAGWTETPPSNYTFSSAGTKTLYAWAKDAAGNVSQAASATVTVANSGTVQDMAVWVGKWFEVVERNSGYQSTGTGLTKNNTKYVGYLKLWDWDPANKVLQGDRYGQDTGGQWFSEPLSLQYIAGTDLDFLCWSQVTGDVTVGFIARIQGKEKDGGLESATFKTLGGYYLEVDDQPGSSERHAGGLFMTGTLIPESKVPVPGNILSH